MIDIKFRIKGNDKVFDDPIKAVNSALSLLDKNINEVTVERGVKYTKSETYNWVSLGKFELPRKN